MSSVVVFFPTGCKDLYFSALSLKLLQFNFNVHDLDLTDTKVGRNGKA